MGKRGKSGKSESGNSTAPDKEPQQDVPFEIRDPIGRQLRSMFDEIVEQPMPDKLRRLLEELARKTPKD
jgi:hypothetical protein